MARKRDDNKGPSMPAFPSDDRVEWRRSRAKRRAIESGGQEEDPLPDGWEAEWTESLTDIMRAAQERGPDPEQHAFMAQAHADIDALTEAEAATALGTTKRALERRRNRGSGPKARFSPLRGCTVYDQADLDEWVRSGPKGLKVPPGYWDRGQE